MTAADVGRSSGTHRSSNDSQLRLRIISASHWALWGSYSSGWSSLLPPDGTYQSAADRPRCDLEAPESRLLCKRVHNTKRVHPHANCKCHREYVIQQLESRHINKKTLHWMNHISCKVRAYFKQKLGHLRCNMPAKSWLICHWLRDQWVWVQSVSRNFCDSGLPSHVWMQYCHM